MADVNKLVPFILQWEGGYSSHPNDPGKQTMRGVTIATYTAYRKSKGLPKPTVQDLIRITPKEWTEILKTMYWDKAKGDEIKSQSVANIIVDWLWASGCGMIKNVQRVVGTFPDGIVGRKTLAAINAREPYELFEQLYKARVAYIDKICAKNPKLEVFRRGWMNRLNSIKYES